MPEKEFAGSVNWRKDRERLYQRSEEIVTVQRVLFSTTLDLLDQGAPQTAADKTTSLAAPMI